MVSETGPSAGITRFQPATTEREANSAAPSGAPDGEPDRLPTEEHRPPAAILPLDVRSVGLGDLAGLRRLDALYRLNQPDNQLVPYSALRAGLGASLPGRRGRRPAFVARSGDRLVGFAQFQPAPPDQRWLLLALGASVGVFDVDPVWEALLTHGVRGAGLRGVKRLYARVPPALPGANALRRVGWAAYARERIFVAHGLTVPRGSRAVRRQEPADTWAIHQLYNAAVPRPVQDAEAYTSHRWDLGAGRAPASGVSVRGWLIEEGHLVVGYACTSSRRGTSVLEVVYHPDRIEVIDDLIAGALAALPDQPVRRVYCAVRGYQAEAATALEARGFASTLEQDLLVKYTTATARLPAFDAVPFQVEVRDKVPQRVPTFLLGRPGGGSATPAVRRRGSGGPRRSPALVGPLPGGASRD